MSCVYFLFLLLNKPGRNWVQSSPELRKLLSPFKAQWYILCWRTTTRECCGARNDVCGKHLSPTQRRSIKRNVPRLVMPPGLMGLLCVLCVGLTLDTASSFHSKDPGHFVFARGSDLSSFSQKCISPSWQFSSHLSSLKSHKWEGLNDSQQLTHSASCNLHHAVYIYTTQPICHLSLKRESCVVLESPPSLVGKARKCQHCLLQGPQMCCWMQTPISPSQHGDGSCSPGMSIQCSTMQISALWAGQSGWRQIKYD